MHEISDNPQINMRGISITRIETSIVWIKNAIKPPIFQRHSTR